MGRIGNLYMGGEGGIWMGWGKGVYGMEKLWGECGVCMVGKVRVY